MDYCMCVPTSMWKGKGEEVRRSGKRRKRGTRLEFLGEVELHGLLAAYLIHFEREG